MPTCTSSAPPTRRQQAASFFALFTSTGTLLCCALPSALAAFAGGAALASFVSAFPWLVTLSHYKGWIFLFAGLMLLVSGALVLRPQGAVACRLTGGAGCEVAGRFSKAMFWAAAIVYVVGAFFAYGLVPLLRLLDA